MKIKMNTIFLLISVFCGILVIGLKYEFSYFRDRKIEQNILAEEETLSNGSKNYHILKKRDVEESVSPKCVKSGFFRYQASCEKYYECRQDNTNQSKFLPSRVLQCPKCMKFNIAKAVCDKPTNVPECDPKYVNSTFESLAKKKVYCTGPGRIAILQKCNEYFKCFESKNKYILSKKKCREGSNFDLNKERCIKGSKCVIETDSCIDTYIESNSTIKCKTIGAFRYNGSCQKYYQCLPSPTKAKKIIASSVEECPTCLKFNAAKGQCDFAENVPECYPFKGNENKHTCTGFGIFPVPGTCNEYYNCTKSPKGDYVLKKQMCRGSLQFSTELKQCNSNTTCTTPTNYCSSGKDYVSDEFNCRKFHRCLNNKTFSLWCPKPLYFNGFVCDDVSPVSKLHIGD